MKISRRQYYLLMRRDKKIRHAEIVKAIGISQSAISQYETGKIRLKHEVRTAYEQYIENK